MKLSSRLIKSTIELMCLSLFILDIFYSKDGSLREAPWLTLLFDYLRYRREAVLNFRESKGLREQMTLRDIRSIERKYSLREDFNTFEKHARSEDSSRPVFLLCKIRKGEEPDPFVWFERRPLV